MSTETAPSTPSPAPPPAVVTGAAAPERRGSGGIGALRAGLDGARSRPAALMAVLALVVAVGAGVWFLGFGGAAAPGRPLGSAGDLRLVAKPVRDGESMEVWKGTDRLSRLGVDDAGRFLRFELTSQDVNVGGGPAADMVVYGWTGGMHCCITHFVIDGDTGGLLGRIEQGDGEPARFVAPERGAGDRAVMPLWDDVAMGQYGGMATSPLGRIVIGWTEEGGFALDAAAMRASSPGSPPAFWTTNPALVRALLEQGGTGDFVPANAPASRGGVAREYQAWLAGLERELSAATLDAANPESFIPVAQVLNAYAYKGQLTAGLAQVRRLGASQGPALEEAVRHWIVVVSESRWFDGLDRLNGGALARLSDETGR